MTVNRRRRAPPTAAALATSAVLVLWAAPAHGDQAPAFTAGPTIAGQAIVGAPMQVVAEWSGLPAPTPVYGWERCDAAGLTCDPVQGACGQTYVPAFDDFGHSLRARVDLSNLAGATMSRTPLSDLILSAPGALPARTAAAVPTSSCRAVVTPVSPPPAASPARQSTSSAPPVATGSATEPAAYMRPFPVVRIRGYSVGGGMRITLLSVSGPRSARILGACAGAGCPRGAKRVTLAAPARLRAFERFLPGGTLLQIRVSRAATIGKYTSFRIRARRAPRRADRCLVPGRRAPAPCPAG